MPQRFGLYEDLTVADNLHLFAELRGLRTADYQEVFARLLAFTRLGPFTGRLAGNLSGGMKQKLGLACALMARPQVLLLDEPGVGVDPVSRQDLWRMVHELTGEGMAVVWSTAYLDEAERCESVILLNNGRIEYDGPPHELTMTLHQRSWRMLDPGQDRRLVLARALGLGSVCDGVIQGSSVRIVLKRDAGAEEIQRLAAEVGGRLEPVAPRFEDAFVDLLHAMGAPAAVQSNPTIRLEAKSPRPLTVASSPNATPCCSCGASSAQKESSSVSTIPMKRPPSEKTPASVQTFMGRKTSPSAMSTARL